MDENTPNTVAGNDVVSDPAMNTAPAAQAGQAPTTGHTTTAHATEDASAKVSRAKGVKGVTKTARDLKEAGKTRAEVQTAVVELYKAGGKSERQAKDAASVILYNIFGPAKTRSAAAETKVPPQDIDV